MAVTVGLDAQSAFAALLAPEGQDDPYPWYRLLREGGPVLWLNRHRAVVSRYRDCDRVLRDPAFRVRDADWADRMWPDWRAHDSVALYFDGWVVGRNGTAHPPLRRSLGRQLTARHVAAIRDLVATRVDGLVDDLAEATADDGPVDFMAAFARPLPMAVLHAVMDLPAADLTWVRDRVEEVVPAVDHNYGGTDLARADLAVRELTGWFADLVAERRRHPGQDMVSALAAGWDPADDAGLVANLIFLAGSLAETTTNLLGNGLAALTGEPELWRRLGAEPGLVPALVTEVVRYDAPVQVTGRWAAEDTIVDGVAVPRDTLLLVLLGSANRDPDRFADPDRFDPGRAGPPVLSFGAGAHYCLGAPMGQLVGEVAFAALVTRFDGFIPAGPPARRYQVATRGLRTLPVRRTPVDA